MPFLHNIKYLKVLLYFSRFSICRYALLTKREVKMAGYWPSSFFAFLFNKMPSEKQVDPETATTHKNKNRIR